MGGMMNKQTLINITLTEETEIFNPFNNEQLSDGLSNYIYSQCKGTNAKNNIVINISHDFSLSNEEKKIIVDAIRANFGIDIKENILRLKYEFLIELILILCGSILLIIAKLFDKINSLLIGEIISIFGCVAIWEVAYNIIFTDIKTLIENKRLKKLTKAKINFIEETV